MDTMDGRSAVGEINDRQSGTQRLIAHVKQDQAQPIHFSDGSRDMVLGSK
jgi:hypothetical protein